MKIFLTGATGFIGSSLAKRLVSEGHELSIIVRPDSKLAVLEECLACIRVHIYDGSYESLRLALEISKPEVVCHIASLFLAQHAPNDVARLIESNINFPTQLVEAMSQLGIKHLINTGTSWQHFENQAYSPVNLYAATKQAFEALLTYYAEAHSFKIITLKLFDTYGPGDTRPKLFSLLRKAARTGEPLHMSPGDQLLDLVYIDDVINAFCEAINQLILDSGQSYYEAYAISNYPALISLKSLASLYQKIIKKNININWGRLPYRKREVMIPWNPKNYILPNWKPIFDLNTGLNIMENL